MSETLQSLAASVSGPALMAHCAEFAKREKLSGTPTELESFHYLDVTLREYGFRTALLSHDAYISLPGKASVTVDGKPITCITHSFSRPGTLTARVVDVGEGMEADFAGQDVKGAIVLAEGIASPHVADRASRAGAAGQIHISPHEHIHEMCISPVWGNPSARTRGNTPTTIVCSVARDDGMTLRARLAKGEGVQATLTAAVDTGWRRTPLLVAEMDAPGAPADGPFVLLSGHHDTWYFGVMDNGSANATMLEAARLAAGQRASWKRGLRVCFWSGHSHGRYSGSAWYADQNWDELERRCVAHVNVDSTGGKGASVLRNAAAAAELTHLAGEAIRQQTQHDYDGKRKNRSSDESFPGIGIPSMFGALSEQPPGPAKMRNALGWWWHTPDDTLDKVDEANLVRDTRVFVHVLWRLLSDDVLPIDYAVHAEALLAELAAIGRKVPDFDLAPLTGGAVALRDAVRAAAAAAPGRRNAAILRASRALVPVDYATGDRFAHDPALPLPSWPPLQPIRDLAGTDGDERRFREVDAVRGRNRMAHALRQATEAFAAAVQ